ncbi:TonB-dependent receptor [Aquisediminimonas profunda]|uniref:TonB-dependent receptor n=1 Tax=Aquisediminimonas profunda TaxID=1550733 RepID=UPI001FE96546|nr:TonB-dependent receptor [Aquisediminimonas profunda]
MKSRKTLHAHSHMTLLAASALALGAAAQAQAQDTTPSDDSGEIIVTAQKRAQSTLDVGITLSVAGAEALATKRIEAVTDLVSFTPNVSVKDNIPGLVPVITIRGVGLNDFSATNNPSAGVYVDEVSLSSLALMNFDFFDIERLEVLKGPQGTLYGRTATAGALNIVTARPSLAGVTGKLGGSWGNYQAKDVEAMVNVPVSDTLALRFAGKGIFQDKGYYFNQRLNRDIGRREVLLGRAQALWEPSDGVEVLLKVEGQRSRSELGSAEFFGAFPTPSLPAGVTCPGAPQCSDFFGYTDTDGNPFRGNWSVSPDYDVNQVNTTARVQADLGFATLTSVTGYIKFDRQWSADTDAGPLPQLDFVTDDRVKQFSQELRLSRDTQLVNWLIGGFYSKDHVETSYSGNLSALFNTTTFTSSDQRSKSAAIFANGEWRLADTLKLVTGARYTSERRTNIGGTTDLVSLAPGSALTGAPFGSPPIPLAVSNAKITDKNWSWKLGLNWKPSARMLVYASATQGIKSGGFFAGVATNSGQLIPYRPEKLIAYEIGIKGRAPSAGLGYSISAFYYDYNDVQTFIRDFVGGLPIQRLGNVNSAEIYGIDADLTLSPAALDGLTLNAGLGLLHSKLGSFASSGGNVPAGNRLPDAPKLSFNTGASYEFSLADTISARFAVDGRYQSSAFKDALNDPIIATKGYWVWNARASVLRKGDWDFSIWGKNLGDKRYVTQGVNQTVLGVGFRVYGAPRTYGISATKCF